MQEIVVCSQLRLNVERVTHYNQNDLVNCDGTTISTNQQALIKESFIFTPQSIGVIGCFLVLVLICMSLQADS
jgi:hypothetical protein